MQGDKLQFKRVIVYARHHRANTEVIETLNRLLDFLTGLSLEAFLDQETADSFDLNHPGLAREKMGKPGDVIIVIGGDGSLLSASRLGVNVGVPVIGINRGRLGFLTDISPQHLEQELLAVLQGSYLQEERFLLQASIASPDGVLFSASALNDIVVSQGLETHLIEFDIFVNDALVSHYRADGIIFATPTGSTAYALSAGGPILHPGLNAVVIVPMFSHRLSSRPLVIDAAAKIKLKPSVSSDLAFQLSADSHDQEMVQQGQWVNIQKHPVPLKLLHPKSYDYFETLRIKLGWEAGVRAQ
jgi:NAD+ kinase